ncbi:MAG: tetratricopeptide repeat protein [Pyrinomonadaceae bacterium]
MKIDSRRLPFVAAALLTSTLLCSAAATSVADGHPLRQEAGAAVAAAAAVPREKRAQAYAKLLEGQRYLIGGGVNDTSLSMAAQQAFEQAIKLDPMLSEAYVGLADIAFFYRSDFNEAERQAAAAIRVNQNSFGAHRVLSRVLTFKSGLRENNFDKEAWERAIAELREVVRLNAADAEGWALLGDFYLDLGRKQEAIAAFTNWESSPAPLDARVYQLITRMQRDLTAESAAARLSEAYLRADRPIEAYHAIRRAMSRNSDNEEYVGQLYDVVMAGGADDASALVELRRFAAASPENAAAQRMLALVQARAGQTDEAVATLQQAVARRAGGPAAGVALRKDLAQTLSNATRYAEAIAVYQELAKELGEKSNTPLAAEEGRREAAQILTNLIGLQKQIGRATDALWRPLS